MTGLLLKEKEVHRGWSVCLSLTLTWSTGQSNENQPTNLCSSTAAVSSVMVHCGSHRRRGTKTKKVNSVSYIPIAYIHRQIDTIPVMMRMMWLMMMMFIIIILSKGRRISGSWKQVSFELLIIFNFNGSI